MRSPLPINLYGIMSHLDTGWEAVGRALLSQGIAVMLHCNLNLRLSPFLSDALRIVFHLLHSQVG